MKKVLVLIQNLLKNKVTISSKLITASLSVKYFNIEYSTGDEDKHMGISVIIGNGVAVYLSQFENTPAETIVLYDRALSGNLDEWLINTIKSTWPTVKVSIESVINIQSMIARLDTGSLPSEKVISKDEPDLFDEALRYEKISKKEKTHQQ